MSGVKLFNEVFKEQIEKCETFGLDKIEDLDGVTCYREVESDIIGWDCYSKIQFRFEGEEYVFEIRDNVSSKVQDAEYFMKTFKKVKAKDNPLHRDIDKIIKYIEEETYGTFEEIIKDLLSLKKYEVK